MSRYAKTSAADALVHGSSLQQRRQDAPALLLPRPLPLRERVAEQGRRRGAPPHRLACPQKELRLHHLAGLLCQRGRRRRGGRPPAGAAGHRERRGPSVSQLRRRVRPPALGRGGQARPEARVALQVRARSGGALGWRPWVVPLGGAIGLFSLIAFRNPQNPR